MTTKRRPKTKTVARTLDDRVNDLGPTGKDLWSLLKKTTALLNPDGTMSTAAAVLALEACRAADRLDDLEDLLRGRREADRLLHFALDDIVDSGDAVSIEVKVTVDGVLAEARQQQNALRQILSTLGHGSLGSQKKGGGILDQLAARRAAREGRGAATSG